MQFCTHAKWYIKKWDKKCFFINQIYRWTVESGSNKKIVSKRNPATVSAQNNIWEELDNIGRLRVSPGCGIAYFAI